MVKQATRFSVQMSWKLLILDMGYKPADVLACSRLPGDLFVRKDATLSPADYFNLWRGLEQVVGVDELPLKLGQAISVEAFDPALFACLCSPDLNTALQRLAQYKRLVGPLTMEVNITAQGTRVTLDCYGHTEPIPRSLGAAELVFFTQLARLATRERIVPLAASTPDLPGNGPSFKAFFGCPLERSDRIQIHFSALDAARPFLTESLTMWEAFEPSLRQRLSALDEQARTAERVRAVLLEMLPAGLSSIDEVVQRLAMSRRSLQRHLGDEGVRFQDVLGNVRQELAQHYLVNSTISPAEISWLLGFQESNSFIRAFRGWTGKTPGAYRSGHAQGVSHHH
jgi:AraC-like DNA-binding protein